VYYINGYEGIRHDIDIINNINYYKLGPLMFRLLKRARISIGKGIDYIYSFLKGTKVLIHSNRSLSY
jgi:hypothetical protein